MDLLVPSSVMAVEFGNQVGKPAAADCSKVKSAVLADAQETVSSEAEGCIESAGREKT
jgi:hypothetical protein